MRIVVLLLVLSCLTCGAQNESKPRVLYQNDFDKTDLRKVPDDMMVMEGGFAVAEDAGNRFLELPGAPLETFGVLFGPTETNGIGVSVRVFGTGKGRRFPTFAVGLNGVGGYKLQISPAKRALELYRGEELLTSAPYEWESGSWTVLRLQSRALNEGAVSVQGKAWKQAAAEPKQWLISHEDKSSAPPGRPSIWGAPYSGTPIRFDSVSVTIARQEQPN
jgi:hypothetical protein